MRLERPSLRLERADWAVAPEGKMIYDSTQGDFSGFWFLVYVPHPSLKQAPRPLSNPKSLI